MIIAIPSAPGVLRGKVVAACRERDIPVRTLPTVFELLRGGVQLTRQLREVQVEDVLGREPVVMELDRVGAYLRGQASSWSPAPAARSAPSSSARSPACARSCWSCSTTPRTTSSEIDREMTEEWHFTRVESVLADCKEGDRMLEVMQRFKPDVVFHAAAYKHVPLMEANPLEAVRNNAIATRVTAETAAVAGARALRPRLDRQGRQPAHRDGRLEGDGGVDRRGGGRSATRSTRFVIVRFGNVLASSGSVVPIFRAPDRARRPGHGHPPGDDPLLHDDPGGGPARDPGRATSARARGEVFVLEMGEPVKIVDLARNMIRLAGYEPEVDIAIEFIGARPGEKLHEELFNADERPQPTAADRIVRAVRDAPARPGLGRGDGRSGSSAGRVGRRGRASPSTWSS